MTKDNVYLYGMTVLTTSNLLISDFPKPDTYAEIKQTYTFPGGETGSCAVVLSSLGVKVIKIDGNYLGTNTYDEITNFFNCKNVDTSRMIYDKEFEGLEDYVFIDKNSRTVFGKFQEFFSNERHKRWNVPEKADIEVADIIGLDPFFFDESAMVARYCNELKKEYVTIDCRYDSEIHKYCTVNVISSEFLRNNYSFEDIEKLFSLYTENTDGLVIFTFGANDILYGRKGEVIKRFSPYKLDIISTLGAGDTFKAGVIYGVLKGMNDPEIVSFAAATAAIACSNFPLALYPPTLDKINALQNSR